MVLCKYTLMYSNRNRKINTKTLPSLKSLLNQIVSSALCLFLLNICQLQAKPFWKPCTAHRLDASPWGERARAICACAPSSLRSQFPGFLLKHLTVHSRHGGWMHSGGADFPFLLPFTIILLTAHFEKGLKLVLTKLFIKIVRLWCFCLLPLKCAVAGKDPVDWMTFPRVTFIRNQMSLAFHRCFFLGFYMCRELQRQASCK